ncbi:hypothetical protein UO65_5228 [Actinokineospora spheciospongiae]|uniref:Uncharacterized protein n=1 Tax=Actinokineospora spheciospongiae TaxID=909613 RepID=W7IF66_9PSEU|nr:hypothetical protein UO65_5228 [Actinokineospora spheciospongiae]
MGAPVRLRRARRESRDRREICGRLDTHPPIFAQVYEVPVLRGATRGVIMRFRSHYGGVA